MFDQEEQAHHTIVHTSVQAHKCTSTEQDIVAIFLVGGAFGPQYLGSCALLLLSQLPGWAAITLTVGLSCVSFTLQTIPFISLPVRGCFESSHSPVF